MDRVTADCSGTATRQDSGPQLLRETFFAGRRSNTLALVKRGKADGQLRSDVGSELVVDLLFGPIVFRLLNGAIHFSPGPGWLVVLAVTGARPSPAGQLSFGMPEYLCSRWLRRPGALGPRLVTGRAGTRPKHQRRNHRSG